jgi:hypothetical protein
MMAHQWEYRSIPYTMTDDVMFQLNEMGRGGWELVVIVPAQVGDLVGVMIFKKPVEAEPEQIYI